MAGFFYKDQIVLQRRGHVTVQITEKFGWIAVSEIVICAYQQRSGMGNLFCLGEIAVPFRMNIV